MIEPTYSAFCDGSNIGEGPLSLLLPILKARFDQPECPLLLIFDNETGRQVDFDLRGTLADVMAMAPSPKVTAGPGRPKMGVVAREITLLPRHWEWLELQPSGASATLRRLVDEARKKDSGVRQAQIAAGRILTALGGNLPGYEEASRALYAGNREAFVRQIGNWPGDVHAYVERMSAPVWEAESVTT